MSQKMPNKGDAVPTKLGIQTIGGGVLTSPAEAMLSRAIALTLAAAPADRTRLFAQLVNDIERFMVAHPQERPWTCTIFPGTDGSTVFRGGVGHSLVIDAEGRLWRGRSCEDFKTTYRFENDTCVIDTLTPLYGQMREYLPQLSQPRTLRGLSPNPSLQRTPPDRRALTVRGRAAKNNLQ